MFSIRTFYVTVLLFLSSAYRLLYVLLRSGSPDHLKGTLGTLNFTC